MSRCARSSRNALRATRLLATAVAVAALVAGVLVPVSGAAAATGVVVSRDVKTTLVGFSAGNIISDAVFTDKSTMTEAQIQTFFNSKVAKCQTGYVCLKDYRITSVTRPADAYCDGYTGAANESAARIIYRVAQSCDINPRVLIVMLQKEQGLVTHTWPSAWRYDSALGQGCPDTAPCDPNFVGFFHQIYGAARQMQIYMEGKWFQWYAPGNTWGILYHPNTACGRGSVYVANAATAALYYYTPYQPNAAALRAGYGEGDSCSAYGNRNFYNYFTDWFGSTQKSAPPAGALASVNTSSYVVGIDAEGKVWGYPFTKGAWGPRTQIGVAEAGQTSLLGLGDLDGDGNRDFAVAASTGRIATLMGAGSTTLRAGIEVAPAGADVKLTAAAGDFDGDRVPDLFTTNKSGQLLLWPGDDRGGFRAPKTVGTGWGGMTLLSGGTDMDGDGNTDLIARDGTGRLHLYRGNGSGAWQGAQQIGSGWSSMAALFSPGDFNGDGRADVLAKTSSGGLVLYPGAAGGTLKAGVVVGSGWGAMTALGSAGAAVTKARAFLPGAGDLDSSGSRDVVAVTPSGALSVYAGDGSGGWSGSRAIGQGWTTDDQLLTLGDFTGDGAPDLARIDSAGVFWLLAGNGAGGYREPVAIGRGWASFAWTVGGIDFDGDRKVDVIARATDGRLLLYRGNGAGGWAETGRQVGQSWGAFDVAANAGDFDGDGSADLLARRSDGGLWLYSSDGAGGWKSATQIGRGWSGMSDFFSPGDFDGNGTIDLLAIDGSGVIWLFRGDGRGGWALSTSIGRGWGSMLAVG